MKEFISKYIFYRVPKEEKNYLKHKLMVKDHPTYRVLLGVIFLLQTFMIGFTLVTSGFAVTKKEGLYLACYLTLAVCCLIFLVLLDNFRKKEKFNAYFVVIALAVNAFLLWGVSISLIDCLHGTDLTTFAYVSIAVGAFIILEPWVIILDIIGYTALINAAIVVMPSVNYYTSVLINSVSICFLVGVCASVNFYRHLSSADLERQVNQLNDTLKTNVYFDDLTKIHNRRYLTEHIDDPVSVGNKPSCCFMFDIDDFKQVNDTYGHLSGDMVLAALGNIINEYIDKVDAKYAVRFGGEEFLIFFDHLTPDQARENAELLRTTVKETDIVIHDGSSINVHISIGVAMAKSGYNYSALINKADNNLYFAKNGGKDQYYFE